MPSKLLAVGMLAGFVGSAFAAGDTKTPPPNLAAAEIVNRNVAARGGLEAWRNVQAISESGQMGAGGDQRGPVAAPTVTPPGGAGPEILTVAVTVVLELP